RYDFPRLPGVVRDTRMTFEMRYSKVPSSPEFDAIGWQEGRALIGEPNESGGNKPLPILVAYFDIDNDGSLDTVVKTGFNSGYSRMANGKSNWLNDEYLVVWRGVRVDFSQLRHVWPRKDELPDAKWPFTENGTYLRPFLYAGRTYLASYEIDLGENYDAMLPKETMSIIELSYTGASSNFTHQPVWDHKLVCRYRMNRIKK
ncbi:MAG TPA: hypothetical protein VGE93_10465, partial [Bryobacteraceae bacterium]